MDLLIERIKSAPNELSAVFYCQKEKLQHSTDGPVYDLGNLIVIKWLMIKYSVASFHYIFFAVWNVYVGIWSHFHLIYFVICTKMKYILKFKIF